MAAHLIELRFCFANALRERFRSGELGLEWSLRYPEIFDADDLRLLKTAHQRRFNFLEWLGAVLMFEATGYRALVVKYGSDNHPRKTEILRRVCDPELLKYIADGDESGWPDLFLFRDDKPGNHFFCEVKGPGDRLREHQDRLFRHLYKLTGIPVRILYLNPLFEK